MSDELNTRDEVVQLRRERDEVRTVASLLYLLVAEEDWPARDRVVAGVD